MDCKQERNRRILSVLLGLKDSDIRYHGDRFILLILFHGIPSPIYMIFSFQPATSSWTADPEGSFPSFPCFLLTNLA